MGMKIPTSALLIIIISWTCAAHGRSIHLVAIASGNGTSAETPLLYTERDARRVAGVFQELGGVDPADSVILVNPSSEKVMQVFQTLSDGRVKKEDELIVYISSHMDSESFHLGQERFTFSKMFSMAQATGASFKIFILDGCKSGAVTAKGLSLVGQVRMIRPQQQVSKGEVVLTSTSSDEYALESERLAGSFFTHFLVSGLRGAADADENGKVSVEEILSFTHDSTVYATAGSPMGSQHPSFKLDLAGSGSEILTRPGELYGDSAKILISHASSGVAYLLNAESGLLEAEFPLKRRGELLVPPGEYRIRVANPDGIFEGYLELSRAKVKDLSDVDFSRVNLLTLVRKGQGTETSRSVLRAELLGAISDVESFSLAPGVRTSVSMEWRSVSLYLGMTYLYTHAQNPNVDFNLHHMGLELGVSHAIHLGPLAFKFGLGLDGIVLYEQMDAREKGVDTRGNRSALLFGLCPLIGMELPVGSNLLLNFSFRGKILFSQHEIGRFAPDLGIGAGWVF